MTGGSQPPDGGRQPDGGREPAAEDGAAAEAARRRRLNSGGLIYGTIVTAAALAVGSGKGDTPGDIADAMAATVIIYWLAHLYTAVASGRAPGSGTPLRKRLWKSAKDESAILGGGLPAFAIFIILWLAGVSLDTDLFTTVCVTLAMLVAGGFLAGRQAGIRGWRLGVEMALAACFGLLLALLMVGLH